MGEGEGGMIWENGIETCILSYVKQIASPGSMHETECSGLVHWEHPEGWIGKEVGEGFRMYMYTRGRFMSIHDIQFNVSQNHYNIVISLQLK